MAQRCTFVRGTILATRERAEDRSALQPAGTTAPRRPGPRSRAQAAPADLSSLTPLFGARVQVLGWANRRAVFTGESPTDAQGGFTLSLGSQGESPNRPVDRYEIRVFDGDRRLAITQGRSTWLPGREPSQHVLVVLDDSPSSSLEELLPDEAQGSTVGGVISNADGTPARGVRVHAVLRVLGGDKQLGEGVTNADGIYSIAYEGESWAPNLQVHVFSKGERLVSSPVHFTASSQERIDVVLPEGCYRGPSEYRRLHEILTPQLSGYPVEELREQDIAILVGTTGLSPRQVRPYVEAVRAGARLSVSPETLFPLLLDNPRQDVARLLSHRPSEVSRRLRQAADTHVVDAAVATDADEQALDLVRASVQRAAVGETTDPLTRLLTSGVVALDEQQQQTVIAALREEGEPGEDFWTGLPGRTGVAPAIVDDVCRVLGIADVVGAHPELIEVVDTRLGSVQAADLATLSVQDWEGLLDAAARGGALALPLGVPADSEQELRTAWATSLAHAAERACPAQATAAWLIRSDPDGSREMTRFLAQHPDFDIGKTNITEFLASADVGDGEDIDVLRRQLKTTQRLYRIGPEVDRGPAIQAMWDAGLTSAYDVARLGRRRFCAELSPRMGSTDVARVYCSARQTNAVATTLLLQHLPGLKQPELRVLMASSESESESAEGMPDFASLFGSLDFCSCEHCRSILSPAAYLVDLLQWLEERNAWQQLRDRRSDLGHIELSCENTNRVMPYIDLAIEILEVAVVNEFGGEVRIPTATTATTEELLAAPEHTVLEAYNNTYPGNLRSAVWPLTLPFNYFLAQARAYLDHLGVPRAHLMRTFRRSDDETADIEIATEELGLSPQRRELVDGVALAEGTVQSWQLWGYDGLWIESEWVVIEADAEEEPQVDVGGTLLLDGTEIAVPSPSLTGVEQADNKLGSPDMVAVANQTLPIDEPIESEPQLFAGEPIVAPGILDGSSSESEPTLATAELVQVPFDSLSDAIADKVFWYVDLRHLPVFMERSQIEYDELLDLLHTRYVNPRGNGTDPIEIESTDLEGCQLEVLYLGSADPDAERPSSDDFDRMHAFLRLWKTTDWTQLELDKALTTLGDGTIEAPTLEAMSYVVQIRRMVGKRKADLTAMLSWWATIDTFEDRQTADKPVRSLYEELFLDRSVNEDPETSPFRLNEDGTELADTDQQVADYLTEIQAALSTDATQLDEAIAQTESDLGYAEPAEETESEDELAEETESEDEAADVELPMTLEVLSHLHRIVSLARVSKLDVREALKFREITGLDPFASPATAFEYLEELAEVHKAKLSVDELAYLLQHDEDAANRVAPTEGWFQEFLGKLRDDLRGLQDSTLLGEDDPTGEMLREALGEILSDESTVEEIMALVAPPPESETEAEPEPEPEPEVESEPAVEAEAADDTLLETHLGTYIDVADAEASLITDGGSITETGQRYTYLLQQLREGMLRVHSETMVVEAFANQLGLEVEAVEELRAWTFEQLRLDVDVDAEDESEQDGEDAGEGEEAVAEAADEGNEDEGADEDDGEAAASGITDFTQVFLMSTFLDVTDTEGTDDPWGDLTTEIQPLAFQTAELLYEISVVLLRLDVSPEEQTWWKEHCAALELLDLAGLPIEPIEATGLPSRFAELRTTVDLFGLRTRLPGNEPALIDLLDELSTDEGIPDVTPLAERTEWSQEDLEYVLRVLEIRSTAELVNVHNLVRLVDCFAIIHRTGASAEDVDGWRIADMNQFEAASIRLAARSRYDSPSEWSNVARPIRDRVREMQLKALVDWLIARLPDVQDTTDLYARYLIDVENSACSLTSRLKQALCSVQLFIQRGFLGLEPGITLNEDDAEDWEWMKNYRVWEAARKVFLYPENWIEPELRDDKSPFFEELEGELMQAELTDDKVEDAVMAYLDKLLDVSQLEILGLYHQVETDTLDPDGDIDLLHVFARTRGEPQTTWYRRLEDGITWTPWEKVTADVKGNHVMPVVHDRRLMLFWPSFYEKEELDADEVTHEFWEIALNWSEYRDGSWSAKRVGKDQMSTKAMSTPEWGTVEVENTYLGDQLLTDDDIDSLNDMGDAHRAELEEIGALVTVTEEVEDVTLYSKLDEQYYTLLSEATQSGVRINLYVQDPDNSAATLVGWFDLSPVTQELEVTSQESASVANLLPAEYGPWYQGYKRVSGEHELVLPQLRLDPATNVASVYWTIPVLDTLPEQMVIVPTQQHATFVSQDIFFLQDPHHTFIVVPDALQGDGGEGSAPSRETTQLLTLGGVGDADQKTIGLNTSARFSFAPFYHPYVAEFIAAVRRDGIMGLLRPAEDGSSAQLSRQQLSGRYFLETYDPVYSVVEWPYPTDDIDFSTQGAYSSYNWELFFHIPFMVACQFTQHQRFDDAMRWFHTIFDPTNRNEAYGVPRQYWMFRPFMDAESNPVTRWATFTGADDSPDAEAAYADFVAQVEQWRDDPFNPHLLARLRPDAYPRATVMRYIDNLIAWGDERFRQDTIETVNEATQLYLLAYELLGRRPVELSRRVEPEIKTYGDLAAAGLDEFSNALIEVENLISSLPTAQATASGGTLPPIGTTAYFCVQPNDRLMGYWDTVEDRLFKIRHCMNIEGVVRQLPLFQPPIDPGMLVRAAAAGVDLGTVLSDLNQPLPHYRFRVMLAKAQAFAATVRGLGGALLAALEKRDAEDLSLLRSSQEIALLDAARDVREKQVDEARESLSAAKKSKDLARQRRKYYQKLIDKGLLSEEEQEGKRREQAAAMQVVGQSFSASASVLSLVPQSEMGMCPTIGFGGEQLGPSASAFASVFQAISSGLSFQANELARTAGHVRRSQEWRQQLKLAQRELTQIDKQIAAAEIRLAIAENELKNHDLQRDNAREVADWMGSKFTNRELYNWMVGQLSTLYYQSYQLAYDTARRAQQCYRHELGLPSAEFVQYGHWDSLRKGLLAGDRLQADLERMDASYLEQDRRELELTRTISLSQLDFATLVRLRQDGECFFHLPEALFDLDFPGHYFRRVRGVSLSMPCVTGPHTGVHATLSMLGSTTRVSAIIDPDYPRALEDGVNEGPYATDERFVDELGAVQSIATSSGQDDTGLFTFDFRDERYLPFEGHGAISTWKLALSSAMPQFDHNSIADVVLTLRYTARDGGDALREAAQGTIVEQLNTSVAALEDADSTNWQTAIAESSPGLRVGYRASRDFEDPWFAFLHPTDDEDQILEIDLVDDMFPWAHVEAGITVTGLTVMLIPAPDISYDVGDPLSLEVDLDNQTHSLQLATMLWERPSGSLGMDPNDGVSFAGQPGDTLSLTAGTNTPGSLAGETVTIDGVDVTRIDADLVADLVVWLHYRIGE